MPRRLNRRNFIAQLLALSATSATLGAAGCSSRATPTPAAIPTSVAATSAAPAPTESVARPPTLTQRPPALTQSPLPGEPAPTAPGATATTVPLAVYPDLAVAHGTGASPGELVRQAVAALGGIEQFVRPGMQVIVKPNICNAYHGPEYASTTNPEVVAALVSLCLGAGAARVRVFDAPFGGTPQNAYRTSGIEAAVGAAGGEMEMMNRLRYRSVPFPDGKVIKKWDIYGDILDADLLINVPIAKDHGSARLTLGMKNLMGIISDRNGFHARGLHQCIADLSSVVHPGLTVIDATRILVANGPTGGNLNDVRQRDMIIASRDVVAADAFATTLFGMTPQDLPSARLAAEMGLGRIDLEALTIERIEA